MTAGVRGEAPSKEEAPSNQKVHPKEVTTLKSFTASPFTDGDSLSKLSWNVTLKKKSLTKLPTETEVELEPRASPVGQIRKGDEGAGHVGLRGVEREPLELRREDRLEIVLTGRVVEKLLAVDGETG